MSKEKMLAMQKQVTGKLMAAISMLLVSAILMCLTSYAWFILSTAPEVSNLKTTAGANGALEIALQSTNKDGTGRADITSAVGSSHAKNSATVSNTYWGNVVDLTEGYGLEHVTLYPSRLKLTPTKVDGKTSYAVDTGSILQVPQFGQDGRVTGLLDATKTHYDGDKFTTGNNWGVNVLGAVSENVGEEDTIVLTYARDIVLEQAREKVATYRAELRDKMETTIAENAMGIMGMFIAYGANEEDGLPAPPNTLNDAVKNYVGAMETVVADATQALRWALLANAAADDKYDSENDGDMKALGALYAAVAQMPLTGDSSVFSVATENDYTEIAEAATAMAAAAARVNAASTLVKEGDISGAGFQLVAMNQTSMYGKYIGTKDNVENAMSATKYNFSYNEERDTEDNPFGLATEDTIFTVASSDPKQTNLFSAIASVIGDYSGDMRIWIKVERQAFETEYGTDYKRVSSWASTEPTGENVIVRTPLTYTIKATSATAYSDWMDVDNLKDAEGNYIDTPRMGVLGQVSKQIAGINAPGTIQVKIIRSDVAAYGYSIDLAFKSSQSTNLLLQQLGITRVSSDTTGSDTEDPATLGGGSTMEFTVAGDMTEEQIRGMLQGLYIVLMNSDTGAIYKVAALDPTSITVNWAAMPVTATGTLALYEPDFGVDGTLSLGGKVGDNVITALVADTELDMTAVVYLSGDAVDSTVFSATQGLSLNGGVNLQFASSTALTPMDYDFTAAETKRKDG